MSDINGGAKDAPGANGAQATAEELRRRAQQALSQGVDTARYQVQQARDVAGQQLGQAQEYLTARIVEKPLTSALTALGAGLVLGLILKGGRRSR